MSQPYRTEPPFSTEPPTQPAPNPPAPQHQQPAPPYQTYETYQPLAPPYDQTYQTPYGQTTAYGQWYPPANYIPAQWARPRNALLFVASILLIILGSFGILADVLAVFVLVLLQDGGYGDGLLASVMALVVTTILYLVSGIIGIKHAANPAKAGIMISLGIAQLIGTLTVVVPIFRTWIASPFWYLASITIPALFLAGALMLNRRATPPSDNR